MLRDFSLTIEEGAVFTVIGPSGAGKSTLLYLLARFLNPQSGRIWYRGKDITDYEVTRLRREVVMVLQRPHMLPGTVLDNLRAGPSLNKTRAWRPFEEIMQLVGLTPDLLGREAASLSGGEQQRVSLGRALALGPKVLLLDEVTSSLNQETADKIEEAVSYLVRKEGMTAVWVTHDLNQAYRVGDVTALIMEGRLVEMGPTADFFLSPQKDLTKRYLEGNWLGRRQDEWPLTTN